MRCVAVCYSVLQCAALCCTVLQCATVCCSVSHVTCNLHNGSAQHTRLRPADNTPIVCVVSVGSRSVWQCDVAVCCSVMQQHAKGVDDSYYMNDSCETKKPAHNWRVAVCCSVLQCVAVCCSVLQCVAVCCSVLQCVAV